MDSSAQLQKLRETVLRQQVAFCCGGTIPISSSDENLFTSLVHGDEPIGTAPVIIRWDGPNEKSGRKLRLPPLDQAEEVQQLLADCKPASFGVGSKEVLDETYRKAAKLDNTEFSSNFSPYDCGIIDAIGQTLLPQMTGGGKQVGDLKDHLCVVAELYKLNVSV